MKLRELLHNLTDAAVDGPDDIQITGIAYDSRRAGPGCLFVATWHPGYYVDKHDYVSDAVARGAAAVVVQREIPLPGDVTLVRVPDSALALAQVSAAFYQHPSRRLGMVGVTGTDGKTTTTTLIAHILATSGHAVAMSTTVAFSAGDAQGENLTRQSTPEASDVQSLLATALRRGARYAVVEATSHALDQRRLDGCAFDVAVVTNVTHEHLDYHGTRGNYLAAKARLLELLGRPHSVAKDVPQACVLNADDESFAYFAARAPVPVLSYAWHATADVAVERHEPVGMSYRLRVATPWGKAAFRLNLPCAFNVYNALASMAAAGALGVDPQLAGETLERDPGVPGRMERIDCEQPYEVVVDYAHTPDSLRNVLGALRPATGGQLIVVFGSAGERDVAKRPQLGSVAAELADFFVITDEDPRWEDSEAILRQIEDGATAAGARAGQHYVVIADRRLAIEAALVRAVPGDTVLLAGKGHEQCILVKDQKLPWDDRTVARELLANLGYAAAVR